MLRRRVEASRHSLVLIAALLHICQEREGKEVSVNTAMTAGSRFRMVSVPRRKHAVVMIAAVLNAILAYPTYA